MSRFTKLLACAALALASSGVSAQSYPSHSIVLVSPYAAGGPVDLLGRLLAKGLSEQLGESVIVENKVGGGASIGSNFVARAPADGYTLLLATPAALIVTPAMIDVPYDGVKDFEFVGMLDNSADMLVVNPAVKASNLKELVALAKAKPGSLSYGTAGVGTSPYIDGESFKVAAGIDMIHVPYKGAAPALTDLVAGHVQVGLSNTSAVLPYVQSGQLRALAYASTARSRSMPDVPTFAEQGVPEVISSSWRVLAAPAGTPKPVIERLAQALARIQADPAFLKQLQDQGSDVFKLDPAKTAQYIREDAARTNKLLATLGVLKK